MRLLFLFSVLLVALPVLAQDAPLGLGIDTEALDADTRPQDDFFRHVNGTWLDTAEIPADRSRYGSFDRLRKNVDAQLRTLIEGAASMVAEDTDPELRKIGAYYTAYLDSAAVEARGLDPIREDFARVDALASKDDLPAYWAHTLQSFGTAPVRLYVGQDQKAADTHALHTYQSGLGLPDRGYYLEDRFAEQRAAYVDYLATLHTLAADTGVDMGGPDAEAAAQTVLDLETDLAQAQWTRVQNRDRDKTYNKTAVADLVAMYPHLGIDAMMEATGTTGTADSIIVRQPTYLAALDSLVAVTPLEDWTTYHRAQVLSGTASYLPSAFAEARFEFYGRTLRGQEAESPRWERAVNATEGALGFAVGKLYVRAHFPPEAKARMDAMIENLRTAFRQSILTNDWMTDATKVEALRKLEKFTPKIGYPDSWRDYSALEVTDGDLVGNVRNATRFSFDRSFAKLGQPVDPDEWGMTPQTVNAYYSPTRNEIVFPAAILQPPFFNVDADDAVNYGGIGAVIGHEFSHGFDDQGRKSDGDGNLRDWWTEADASEYERRSQKVVDQYNAFTPIDTLTINGELTLGENIADLAGLTMAHRAYLLSLDGAEPPVVDGYTADQRFFMGWAQVWRIKHREAYLRQLLQTDSHSPGAYRVNGIVPHLAAFYEAFDVSDTDGMYLEPDARVVIW